MGNQRHRPCLRCPQGRFRDQRNTKTATGEDRARWPVGRRRNRGREEASEPLFGEDWWVADQRLFEDSLARRETPRPPRRRAGKTANLRKQETARAKPRRVAPVLFPTSSQSPSSNVHAAIRSSGSHSRRTRSTLSPDPSPRTGTRSSTKRALPPGIANP